MDQQETEKQARDRQAYKNVIVQYEIQKNAEDPKVKKLTMKLAAAQKKLVKPARAFAVAQRNLVEHIEKTYLPEQLKPSDKEGAKK